jgi:NAD(P)-dependent dehydrogenase (short-subunit alcohol dehydrogenase family)
MTVLIHGRDQARGEQLVTTICEAGGAASFYPADFSSLAEVHRLAEDVRRDHAHLDVLINNAGIGVGGKHPGRCESGDGHELRFAINYLAGFLLTRLFLPLLTAGAPARIVNVASAGQQAIDFSDVMLKQGYSGRRAYCQSKLAQILFTFDLAADLKSAGVMVNALHPATYMDTTMVRGDGIAPVNSIDKGADAILSLAVSPEMANRSGLYFDGLRTSRAEPQAYDAAARARLRAISFDLTGLSPVVS